MRFADTWEFDYNKEYAQGEKARYKKKTIVCRRYNDNLKTKRCALCVIQDEDCPPQGLKCSKSVRKDNKNVYYADYKRNKDNTI